MARQNPLLLPFLAFAGGIWLAAFGPFTASPVTWAEVLIAIAVLAITAAVARSYVSGRAAAWPLLAAAALLGMMRFEAHKSSPPVLDYEPGETLVFTGCVIEPPIFFEARERFAVELAPHARAMVNVYLKPGQQPPRFRYGDRVEFEARVRKPRNFQNPGSFDYAGYLARRDIHWNLSLSANSTARVLPEPCGSRALSVVYKLRLWSLERLDGLFAEETAASRTALGMSRAVLLGDDSRLEKIWTESFRRTGTYHALVISGLHLTTLAACLLFLMRVIALGPGWSLSLTAAAAWFYALMAGGQTPVTRAAAGLTLFCLARLFFRRPRLLNVLAVTGLVFLAIDPGQLFEASFHLSFLSVAMIGAFAAPLLDSTVTPYSQAVRHLADHRADPAKTPAQAAFRVELRLLAESLHALSRFPLRACMIAVSLAGRVIFFFIEMFLISAVIQAGMILPMAAYFHRISLSGLSANLLVVPLTNVAVPTGFLAIATGWKPLASITAWLLMASQSVAEWHARLEPNIRIPAPPEWLTWAFLLALAMAGFAIASTGARGKRSRIGAALTLMMGLIAVIVVHPFAPQLEAGSAELTAIDVGQGDSLLVAAPGGGIMLVDAGGFPVFGRRAKPALDIGEDVVSPYLWSRSIRRIDVLVATHAHEDHIGGLAAIIDNFSPRELWTGALAGDDPAWIALCARAAAKGVRIVVKRSGEQFDWSGLRCEVLSPDAEGRTNARGRNNESLVLRLTHGETSFLLTGDIERQVEQRLVADGSLRRSDVLKIAHHGSRTSTTAPFLEAVRPSFAIISDGYENVYRFPHPTVLERLSEAGVRTWRTDLDGLVTIRSDGRRLNAESRRETSFQHQAPFPVIY